MKDRARDCCEPWVQRTFGSAWFAFATLFAVMAVLAAAYLGIHAARTPPKVPWETAVRLFDDGQFKPRFQVAVLERFFSEQELMRLTDIVNGRCNDARNDSNRKRRFLFSEVKTFLDRNWNMNPPTDRPDLPGRFDPTGEAANAGAFRMTANVQALAAGSSLPRSTLGLFEKKPAEWKDEDVLVLSVSNVVEVLRTALQGASAETREKGNVLVTKLQLLAVDEATLRAEITAEIAALEPPLSFRWLHHEGSGWVFEVVFWTWFGVLANSIIAVILECKKGNYRAGLFSLVIPKFFLAPLISIVFVALWAAGVTNSEVKFVSLPWFMAFAFFLGFMTESLYARLRKFADAILGGATEYSGRLPGGPGRDYHQWRNPRVDVADLIKPSILSELEKALKKVAQGEMEHTIVTEKARAGDGATARVEAVAST